MATVEEQVRDTSDVIVKNIDSLTTSRGFLSQNVLQQLRHLVEGLIVWAANGKPADVFDYSEVGAASSVVKATAKYRLLSRFHDMLQASVSHYTLGEDPSERLMLKYYEYLLRTRDLAKAQLGIAILENLHKFPLNTDPALSEYHEKIAGLINTMTATLVPTQRTERYYVHHSRPFFVHGRIYYEVTFSLAHNRTNKFDRNIAFTDIDMTDRYAANLELATGTISVFSETMPVTVIRTWSVSLRPCELDNFSRLFSPVTSRVSTKQPEYERLMEYLTKTHSSLLDLVDLTDPDYLRVRTWALEKTKGDSLIFSVLDRARDLIQRDANGSRVLRYLLLRMRNETIKSQYDATPQDWLSNLHITSQSKPFDTMPLCTSPRGHVPSFGDLMEAFDSSKRQHELLARRINTNVEQHGQIYTAETDLAHFGDLDPLIEKYNRLLPPTPKHAPRKLCRDVGHVFMVGYEDGTVSIIDQLQSIAAGGLAGHAASAAAWVSANSAKFDDPFKANALTDLFEKSTVALIYGAAGTGKTTMVDLIANYFANDSKLFLAHTNPAVANLEKRVTAKTNSEFSTIYSHTKYPTGRHYRLLIIDECSTVSNASLLKVLQCTDFDLLVLVGDVYQIESIEFGNWFSTIRSYLPPESVFELTQPFRTTDPNLRLLWDRVRSLDDKIEESISKNHYATVLGDSLFKARHADEIVLCLNYDGLYGINNVNRFLQASNPSPAVHWGDATFKVNDPILFGETDRFGGIVHNNLKGTIVNIATDKGRITFDVKVDKTLTAADFFFVLDIKWLGGSVVQFDVLQRGNTDDDDDASVTIVPFQIAYAVSIHKAQGLEFNSVKVVITDANEDRITHAILYTAITRARQFLEIFWSAEVQQRMLSKLVVRENSKDEAILRKRRGVVPVAPRPKLAKSRPPV
ncbi:AAA family ATPase [Cryobacterium sp. BB307]|uniref:ATP-dependent DNA helicase n=1 Tax=Cryobacterium sp. BB307 TaxID=2716317 RepID=UPI0014450A93|nr:AAA family ATPase [Cryobacterium sp. BB307]